MSSIRADLTRRVTPLAASGAALLGALLLFAPLAGASWASPRGPVQATGVADAPDPEPGRGLVFSEVSVSREAASILLEFEGGLRRSIEFRGGQVRVDGAAVGGHTPGDALERAWRSLLGEALAADNGDVARLLLTWTPPTELEGRAEEAGLRLAETLQEALAPSVARASGGIPAGLQGLGPEADRSLLGFLIQHPDRAADLARLVEGATLDGLEVRVGQDLRVEAGERREEGVLVVDGDLWVEGLLAGSAYLLGGSLRMGEEGRILGEARVLDGAFLGAESAVEGGIRTLDRGQRPPPASSTADLRGELERGFREGIGESQDRAGRSQRAPSLFRNLVAGIGNLLQVAVTAGLLLLLGVGVLYLVPRPFDVVCQTVAAAPGRALATGWAALLLSPALWIIGIVVLAISIVGILALVLWIPFFWPLLALAALTGYLAAARNVGTWWVRRREAYHPQGLDPGQPAARLGIGLVLLLSPFALAALFQMGGALFGIFRGISILVGILLTANAAALGLGGVLLSRGGRDARWADPYRDPYDPDDPGFGQDPFAPMPPPPPRGPHTEGAWSPADRGAPAAPPYTGPASGAEGAESHGKV